MTILLLITLASVIPDVYKSEESFGSCPKNEPFRMDDGSCLNFTNICIREESSKCKSVMYTCSQCPPSGYTISMLATLNSKINELSTLRKEIINIKNMSDSSRKQVELLPTLNEKINGLSNLTKEIKDINVLIGSVITNVGILPSLNEKINELSTLRKDIKDIKNMSDSSRKQVQVLPTLNDKMNELSTLTKEIINIKNMSDSSRKQVELLPDLNVTRNETLTIRKEIKDLKNDGLCLKILCVLCLTGIAFIIGFCIFKIVRDKLNCGDEDKEVYIQTKLQNPGVQNKRKSAPLNSNTQTPKKKEKDRKKQNPGDENRQISTPLNQLNTGDKDEQEYIPLTSRNLGDKNIQESDPLTSTPGPYDNVFGKLDETNEKLDKMMPILAKHGQDIVNINKTLVGQNQALIRQILGGRDQETNNQPLDPFGKLDETNEKLDKPLNPVHVSGKPGKRNEKLDKTPGPYDNVFGKFDEINEKLDKMLNTLAGQNKEMIDQIISVLLSTRLSQDENVIRSILDETKLDDQKPEQIPSPAVPEGVGGSNTKQITSDKPEYHSYKE